MKASRKAHAPWWFLLFAVLFTLQVLPRFWGDSLTNDEPMEITNGYYFLTQGDVRSHAHHPPFSKALQSLPLLGMRLNEALAGGDALDRAHSFFFVKNAGKLRFVTYGGRSASLLLGLGIGLLLYFITRREPSSVFFMSLVFWAFDPTLLAFSGLALADGPAAFFFLAAVLSLKTAREKKDRKIHLLAGILAGMAVTCKFSAFVLIPVFLVLEFFPGLDFVSFRKNFIRDGFSRWLTGAVGFALWIFLLYLPGTLKSPGHLSPFRYFWEGFRDMAHYQDHPVYFMGQVDRHNHWDYFPTAFILKSPLPFLFLLAMGLALLVARKIKMPAWQWAPGLLFFVAIVPVQNLGVRYLLPAYPFFMLLAAQAAGWVWHKSLGKGKRFWRWGVTGLALFQVLSVGLSYPRHISYFNELVSQGRKVFWLGDSNLDISQDLKRLSAAARERHWGLVKLAYLGGSDPSAYGLSWEPWQPEDLAAPRPGTVYAVNTSFFQLAPVFYPETLPIAQGWLSETPPTGKIGDTWYYFETGGTSPPRSGKISYLFSAPFLQHRSYAVFE